MYVGGKLFGTSTNAENVLAHPVTTNTTYYVGLANNVDGLSSLNSDSALRYITTSVTTSSYWSTGTSMLNVPGSIYSVDGSQALGNLLYTPKVTVGAIPHTGARPSDVWVDPDSSAIYQWILDSGNGYWLQIAII